MEKYKTLYFFTYICYTVEVRYSAANANPRTIKRETSFYVLGFFRLSPIPVNGISGFSTESCDDEAAHSCPLALYVNELSHPLGFPLSFPCSLRRTQNHRE